MRFAHTRVQGFVIDRSMKLEGRSGVLQETFAWSGLFDTRTPEAKPNMQGTGGRMHPTKVVVLKLHSPRKPLSAPQYATDAGCRAKRLVCAWHAPGRLELPQVAHSHDALTNPIQIHSIARLNRIVSGITDRAARQVRLLTLRDDD